MIRILLVIVCIISLAVPFFNSVQPKLFGFPFFYWYQLATVPVGALLIFIVYIVEDRAAEGANKK